MGHRIWIGFYECEHSGDLDWYMEGLKEAGAVILDKQINHEAETGRVLVEVADLEAFKARFRKTEQYGFSSIGWL